MVAPTPPPPRLIHLSTPPLLHGLPATIRGPGLFMRTPCPCRVLPTWASWGRIRPPTGFLRGAPALPGLRRPPSSSSWDPALLTALQSFPSAGAYGGGGDWFMDTGSSAHMAAHPGNLSFSTPGSTSSRIIMGNGHALPITHTGSSFCRDNPVTVEFDAFGFSVKDGRTWMLLHRCDSPGDLYPVGSASTTASSPLALSAGVDLWHARLGHPSSATLGPIMQGFSFTLILDDYSHFVWTFPLSRKSDVAATLTTFFAFVSTQFGRHIHALQTDNGKEFDNITIRSLLAAHGTVFRLTCPYTSPQNGTFGDTSDDAPGARWPSCGRAPTTDRGGSLCAGPAWSLGVSVARGAPGARDAPVARGVSFERLFIGRLVARLAAPREPILTRACAGVRRPSTRYPADQYICMASPSAASAFWASGNSVLPHDGGVPPNRPPDLGAGSPPPSRPVITGKWVFKHKLGSDGTLEHYKARWVVHGFRQRAGVDFTDMFAPVVKPGMIRTALYLAASRAWPVHQMDVSNAFLHGHLSEQVYCQQPIGFVDAERPDDVCLLSRSLYGLKQAPRAWYQRIAGFLHQLGFRSTRSDASLFVYRTGNDMAYLLLYVDNIILTASTAEVVRRADGFFLHQRKYAHELLERAWILNCNPAPSPVDTKAKLSASDGSLASDAPFYRSIVGALQYLTLTRPELQYVVEQLLSELSCPIDKATVVFCDNVSAVYLSANPLVLHYGFVEWLDPEWLNAMQKEVSRLWAVYDDVNNAKIEQDIKHDDVIYKLTQEKRLRSHALAR
ncbi:uncharacterized protein [Lolium perenne]|uniref:uncharacterized protein n=1 Tax=Lolium perenne TaxID=4522 RepID=UPI003A98E2A3